MKKLMMLLAVATAASVASAAATLGWRTNTSAYTVDGDDMTGFATILVVTAAGSEAPTLSWNNGALTVSGGKIWGIGNLNAGGTTSLQAAFPTGKTWEDGSFTQIGGSETITPGYSYVDAYEFVFDSATISEASKYQLGGTQLNKRASKATNALTLNFSGAALSSENWNNIPEPCTVALLALGMGALALRRKQR